MATKAKRRSVEQWNALKPEYRQRLVSAARSGKLTGTPITGTPAQIARKARSYYISGSSLASGRGKHPSPKRFAAPKAAAEAASKGTATNEQLKELRRWRDNQAPTWIRQAGFSEDTAAILERVRLLPRNWKSVEFYPQQDGTVIAYFNSRQGGKPRKVTFPDSNSALEVKMFIYGFNDEGGGSGQMSTEMTVRGTDEIIPGGTNTNRTRRGRALGRKRAA
jgi:hypothetical protein